MTPSTFSKYDHYDIQPIADRVANSGMYSSALRGENYSYTGDKISQNATFDVSNVAAR